MIKRFLILFFIVLTFGGTAFAQSQFSPTIAKMEKSLFGLNYNSQNDEARLKRIEELVYGEASSNSVAQRVNKLSKDLSADLIGQEIKPKTDTFADEEDSYKEAIPKADSNVNYPIVDKLEDVVFNKEYKSLDINKRLAGLEQKSFNKVYGDDSLNGRVERLRAAVMPQNSMANSDSDDSADNYSESMRQNEIVDQNMPSQDDSFGALNYNSQRSVLDGYKGNTDGSVRLSALERSILKKSFPDDSISNRLTRLEHKVFNTSFEDGDPQERIERLSSAYKAQKTAKRYDNNKFTKNMSTAMQVGAMLLMVLAFVL